MMPQMPIVTAELEAARALLAQRITDFQIFLQGLAAKDRPKVEKQIAACELAGTTRLYERLACMLLTLAPHQPKVNAQQSIQFYIADGKHRKQIFALEDGRDHTFTIYCHDVVERAMAADLIQPAAVDAEATTYRIVGTSECLFIERIDGSVINPIEFFKHMVGWNRKALRIKLPITATETQIATAELLCALSMSSH